MAGVGVLLLLFVSSCLADDKSTLLNAPKLPPYQWFASTDAKHQNEDYISLKPGETRRIPLTKGVLLRLWSTALEPDKIELGLQNGKHIGLFKGGPTFSRLSRYYEKAYAIYPWQDWFRLEIKDTANFEKHRREDFILNQDAALIVTNHSKQPNKWFYQAAIRSSANPTITEARNNEAGIAKPAVDLNWGALPSALHEPARRGQKLLALPANAQSPYQLCMAFGSSRTQKGKPIPILNVTGEGAFVGLLLDIKPAHNAFRRTFAFLEGNETITADNKKYEGTGTEDFFNSAWYFPDKPFSQLYHGLTFKSTNPPHVTAYRWMVPDAVPFKKSFKFEFEHGNGNNDNDLEYRWVAFWYQKPPFKYEVPNILTANASTLTDSSQSKNTKAPILAAIAGVLIVGGWVLSRRLRRA